MPKLDLFTLNVVTAVLMLVTGVVMLLTSTLNRKVHGLRRCAAACFILFAAFVLYPVRLVIPGKMIVMLPNLFLFAGAFVLLDGIRAFRGLRRLSAAYALAGLVYLTAISFWLFVRDDMNARVVVGSLFVALPALFAALAMASDVPHPDRRIYWSTAAGFGIHGFVMLLRALLAMVGQPRTELFQTSPIDMIGAGTLNLAAIGCAFGLSLATNLKLQRETEKLAHYDSLTNLPNRRLFEERLESAGRRASATGKTLALVYCDLDDFKGINDTLGHEGGDKALRHVGNRLREVLTDNVSLARVGGDEFLLLVENVHSRAQIHGLIDRLRRSVEGKIEFEGRSAALKISCGLALYPDDVSSVSDLIRVADASMYTMKQHGRFPSLQAVPA